MKNTLFLAIVVAFSFCDKSYIIQAMDISSTDEACEVQKLFLDAIDDNNWTLFNELLELSVDVNCADKNGNTALHKAVCKKLDFTRLLLQHPRINVNAQNKEGETPAHCALLWGRCDTAQLILNHPNLDVTVVDTTGWTLLQQAARFNRHAAVELLLARGASPYEYKKGTDSPLELALYYKHVSTAESITQYMANSTQASSRVSAQIKPVKYLPSMVSTSTQGYTSMFTVIPDYYSSHELENDEFTILA